ncbi:uncharacterized protein [Branchiostoma lanceolatum]|uniref:uncharacterized protein n=1 Tax=Branchiostoma lanceolatum TaxID=7740 RepID=UPI003455EB41
MIAGHGLDQRQGHDRQEPQRQGHDRQGHQRQGHDRHGHQRQGHDRQGHQRQGHDRHARAVVWMDACRSQGTLVTPSRVNLNGGWTDIELYSLQVGRSVFQRFYAVKCVERTPTANCQGECQDKRSQYVALEIYEDSSGDLKVRPRLVDVTTCCQLVISA